MNHFEFKKKYILLLYQTEWNFIDSTSVLEFSHRFTIASNNPILSSSQNIEIPHGELMVNISSRIINSDSIILDIPRGELFMGYSAIRTRVSDGVLINLIDVPYIIRIFYGRISGASSPTRTIHLPNGQIISRYKTIQALSSASKIITISNNSFSVVYHSPTGITSNIVDMSGSMWETLIYNLTLGVSNTAALIATLLGTSASIIRLDVSSSTALSAIWTWPVNNMFIVNMLTSTGNVITISFIQASVIYRTIISIYIPLYISDYDDGSLLSDVENLTLMNFSYRQITP